MKRTLTLAFMLALGFVLGAAAVGAGAWAITDDVTFLEPCPVPIIKHRPGPLTAPRA